MTCLLAWSAATSPGEWWRVAQCRNLSYGCQWETIQTLSGSAQATQVSGLAKGESQCWQIQAKGQPPSNVVCR